MTSNADTAAECVREPDLLDRAATARKLGISPARLTQEVAAGTVPPPLPLVGRKKLWSRAQLDRWLAGPEAAPSDPIMEAINAKIEAAERQGATRPPATRRSRRGPR